MTFHVTTKFGPEIADVIIDLREEGVRVEYIVKEPDLFGQGTNVDDRVELRYLVDVLFVDMFRRRDGGSYLPSNQGECWMASQPFKPKPGDIVITPYGKHFPVDQVQVIAPDGAPIIYNLRLIDG